jgi:hypothetical protein
MSDFFWNFEFRIFYRAPSAAPPLADRSVGLAPGTTHAPYLPDRGSEDLKAAQFQGQSCSLK